MLDIRFVRENPDAVRAAARKKRMDVDVDAVLECDQERRKVTSELDAARGEMKARSKAIGALPPDERASAAADMQTFKAGLQELEAQGRELDERLRQLMLRLPNVPADEVPEGKDDRDNVELRRVGEPPQFEFEPLDHIDLGTRLGILDVERAGKVAGARQYILKGMGCRLELAVLQYALQHMIVRGFTPVQVPTLVRYHAMEGTAYFPGGEEQAYKMARDDLYLIGTSEVPLTSLHQGEILTLEELPLRYVAMSPCYRREAGAAGKDTRGLYRIHQFWKVEQVIIDRADPDLSRQHHLAILQNSEELLQAFGLPYRVVNVCGGDLGQPQIQKFDIETWMPSRGGYGETHSASRFHDFQARRLNLRYRDADGKPGFCHTLNNTVVASPRILIPLLENLQQADGSVRIPEVLRPFLDGADRIA